MYVRMYVRDVTNAMDHPTLPPKLLSHYWELGFHNQFDGIMWSIHGCRLDQLLKKDIPLSLHLLLKNKTKRRMTRSNTYLICLRNIGLICFDYFTQTIDK
jgi:hypothetical protein